MRTRASVCNMFENFSAGLVLTSAQQIVFMEPLQDGQVRKRAIGTVVRIGQVKKVKVVTLRTSNTIDDTVYGDIFGEIV